ncbi:MAG TPA: glycosyltransferase family 4 protein [Acidimicrobiia bacterium]|jgi:phosphatidylinositol alpha-mannosyltransferase
MRVAIVCPYDLDLDGGVQAQCLGLAARLPGIGIEATLVGAGAPPGGVGLTVKVRANRSTNPITVDPRSWLALRRRLASADVVHVHEPFIPLVGWAAITVDKPAVATFHADPAPWTRRLYRVGAGFGRRVLRGCVVTAASEVAASALPPAWGEAVIVPNGIDVAAYDPGVERLPNRVVFLGRDDPRKGLDVLLAAWPGIRQAVPDAELLVLGRVQPRALAGVEFRGWVEEDEKRRLLGSASVMVAPNLGGESFGITVAEAMAAGCAVVASDLPAFTAVLAGSGALVARGQVEPLRREVTALLTDHERARQLGEAARRAAQRFDWDVVTRRYGEIYESAVTAYRTTIRSRKE